MDGRVEAETFDDQTSATGPRLGRVRWTICAMLFAATSINYMDRQVLSLLKPTLMHDFGHGGIGMTEVGYGYITAAFQVAYALGLILAGRFVFNSEIDVARCRAFQFTDFAGDANIFTSEKCVEDFNKLRDGEGFVSGKIGH